MLHNEHLRKADESYEIRHDNNGNAIHVYIKDGEAVIFPCLHDLIRYVYFGDTSVDKAYTIEENLDKIYESGHYNFYSL